MIINKINIIIIKLLIFLLLFSIPSKSTETFISLKVNNEIITNYDILQESKYLNALNSELKKLDNSSITKLSKNSLIREKIKMNEILKYFTLNKNEILVNQFTEKFYTRLNFENEKSFEDYLLSFDLNLKDIKSKFEIELLWNELIKQKFTNQININQDFLKNKIKIEKLSERSVTEFQLSEILFQTNATKDLDYLSIKIENNIIENGFNNTANVYSISDTAKYGGEIGWVSEAQLSKDILGAIRNLNIGEISKPIKTIRGYLILKINDKKKENIEIDEKIILKNLVNYETQRQYKQFSLLYYNKIKLNNQISE
jgi:peptidyl-prolyl cis-trans isomerase SurA